MPTLTIVLENATDATAVAQFLRETMPEDLRVEFQKAITEKLAEAKREEEKLHADFDKEAVDGKYTVEEVANALHLLITYQPADKWRRAQYEHWLAKKDAEKRKEAQEALLAVSRKVEEDNVYRQVCEEMCTLHKNVPGVAAALLKHAKRGTRYADALYANALHRWLQDASDAVQELEVKRRAIYGKSLTLEEAEDYHEVVVSLREKWPACNKIKCELTDVICKINSFVTTKAEELGLRFTDEFKQKAGGEGRKHVEECLALAERQKAEVAALVKKYPHNREMDKLLTTARVTVHNWKELAALFDEERKERLARAKASFEEAQGICKLSLLVYNEAAKRLQKVQADLEVLEKEKP